MTPELMRVPRVAPSILSADFDRLGEQVEEVLDAGARVIHVDVMDGHFVPPITMGPLIVGGAARADRRGGSALDVHLMIERPERQIAEFARAGADRSRSTRRRRRTSTTRCSLIRDAGLAAGPRSARRRRLAVSPRLPTRLDLALCMSVNPGWGGQSFIEASIDKLARARSLLREGVALEVDGGIEVETGTRARAAGAGVFVAGSAVFGSSDPAGRLRRAGRGGRGPRR